jgi:hypothetical protein
MLHSLHAHDGGTPSSLHPHNSRYPSPVRQRRNDLLGLLTPPPILHLQCPSLLP